MNKKNLTPDWFKQQQDKLGKTNEELAEMWGKSSQTISNYRNGRQVIPDHVENLFRDAFSEAHAAN